MTRVQRELGARERDVLDFERDWPLHRGHKLAAIHERFGISPARYYQLLARVVAEPAALAYDPLTVRRIRRRREALQRRRATAAVDSGPQR